MSREWIRNFHKEFFCRPRVRKDKKHDDRKVGWNTGGGKEPKPKVTSRIDTNIVNLKLLDATRKAIIDKQRKVPVSVLVQTEPPKTKLFKDQSMQLTCGELMNHIDQFTETEFEFLAFRATDGARKELRRFQDES